MAFLTQRTEELAAKARAFVQAWGAMRQRGLEATKKELSALVDSGAEFSPDGVVYAEALKGLPALLESLEHEHSVYEHVSYEPVAAAANEDGTAFVGVAWEMRNVGPLVPGGEATGRTSKGFSVEQLEFNSEGRIVRGRVHRQMTAEERDALLEPGARCQPADVFTDVLPKMGGGTQEAAQQGAAAEQGEKDEEDMATRMANSIMTWVHCWSSSGDVAQLDRVLDPAVVAYDGYGFHAAADRPGREGHAMSLRGREEARASILELRRKFSDRNKLLHLAVDPSARVAFDHWRGEAKGRGSDTSFACEGVDFILFNRAAQQITCLLQFDMQDYSRLLRGAEAPAGAAQQAGGAAE